MNLKARNYQKYSTKKTPTEIENFKKSSREAKDDFNRRIFSGRRQTNENHFITLESRQKRVFFPRDGL